MAEAGGVTPAELIEKAGSIAKAAKQSGYSRPTLRKLFHTKPNERIKVRQYKKAKTVLFLPDVHCPYQDDEALKIMRKWLEDWHITHVVLGGDFCDFFEVSSYPKKSRMHFDEELERNIGLLGELKEWFPLAEIIYLEGNHEDRLPRYVQSKAPNIARLRGVEVAELLELDRLNIKYIRNKDLLESTQRPFKIGNLYYLHGHEIMGGGIVNIARSKFLKVQQNIIFGHHHTNQSAIFKQLHEVKGSWAVGCMCNINPSYLPMGNQHVQGFAVIVYDKDDSGDFAVYNKMIINGKVK